MVVFLFMHFVVVVRGDRSGGCRFVWGFVLVEIRLDIDLSAKLSEFDGKDRHQVQIIIV